MNRRGASTIVIVVVLLGIILAVQSVQQMFTGRVTDQAFRNVYGRTANDLAGTAVVEMRSLLEKRLNDSSRPEFARARENNSGPSVRFAFDVPTSELTETARLITEHHKGAFKIQSTAATLVPLRPLSGFTPIEYEGVLTVTAVVQSTADPGIVRKVTRTWMTKLVHIAPAGPLAAITVMIRAPADILRGRWDAPELARQFIDDQLPGLIADLTKTVADLDRQAASADSQMKNAIQQIRAIYAPLVEGAGGGRIGQIHQPLVPRFKALTALPTVGSNFLFISKEPQLGIAELDLQGDLQELVPKFQQASAALEVLGNQVKANQGQDAAAQAMHQRYVDDTAALAAMMGKIAERYLRFREKLTLVPAGDATLTPTLQAYSLVNPQARMPGFDTLPAFDPRVCYISDEAFLRVSANECLQRLMGRLERDDDGVQGVMMIQNSLTPLTLTGTLRGRWTLVVSGSLVIDNLKRTDPARDLFTVVQMSSDAGTLSLSGTVDATVIASGKRMTVAAGTQVNGGLFVTDVDPGARIDPVLDGPELVKLDSARSSADGEKRRHAVVSPWTRSTAVERNQ